MNSISHIRAKLGVTQQVLADGINVSQGNISHYERGQSVPPDVAKRLITFAGQRGHELSFDDIYGKPEPVPQPLNDGALRAAETQVNTTGETA